jgi:hypothetical protein
VNISFPKKLDAPLPHNPNAMRLPATRAASATCSPPPKLTRIHAPGPRLCFPSSHPIPHDRLRSRRRARRREGHARRLSSLFFHRRLERAPRRAIAPECISGSAPCLPRAPVRRAARQHHLHACAFRMCASGISPPRRPSETARSLPGMGKIRLRMLGTGPPLLKILRLPP